MSGTGLRLDVVKLGYAKLVHTLDPKLGALTPSLPPAVDSILPDVNPTGEAPSDAYGSGRRQLNSYDGTQHGQRCVRSQQRARRWHYSKTENSRRAVITAFALRKSHQILPLVLFPFLCDNN
jgi:hypothetical protein